MSRLAKKPIRIPDQVKIKITEYQLEAQGPKGQEVLNLPQGIEAKEKGQDLMIIAEKKNRQSNRLLGTGYSLAKNLLIGVSQGHSKSLIFKGIGYQAEPQGNKLVLKMGFSHPVEIVGPKDKINFKVEKDKIIVSGTDKQVVGEIAAQIRRVRPVDPYKQKGIKYQGERVIEKEGKAVEKLEETS